MTPPTWKTRPTPVVAIFERTLGPEDPEVATALNNISSVCHARGRDQEAEPLLLRALAIREKALGPRHPALAVILDNYATLLGATGRPTEARVMRARAEAVRAGASP